MASYPNESGWKFFGTDTPTRHSSRIIKKKEKQSSPAKTATKAKPKPKPRMSTNPKPRMSTDHKAYTCTVCKKELSSRHALDVHQLVHVKETHKLNSLKRKHSNVFQCSTCPRAYAKSASLARHQSINHNGTHKKLLCEYCQRKFNYSTSLRLHIANYHTQEKPFACQFCEKTFGISSNLKNHERIHTGEKHYKCAYCKERFASTTKLTFHISGSHGAELYDVSKTKKRMMKRPLRKVPVVTAAKKTDKVEQLQQPTNQLEPEPAIDEVEEEQPTTQLEEEPTIDEVEEEQPTTQLEEEPTIDEVEEQQPTTQLEQDPTIPDEVEEEQPTNQLQREQTIDEVEEEQPSTQLDQDSTIDGKQPTMAGVGGSPTQSETIPTNQTTKKQRRKRTPAHTQSEILPERAVRTRKAPSRYYHHYTPARAVHTTKVPKLEYKATVSVHKKLRNREKSAVFEMIEPESPLFMFNHNDEVPLEYEEPDMPPIQIVNSYSLAHMESATGNGSTTQPSAPYSASPFANKPRAVPSYGRDSFICKLAFGLVLEGVEFPSIKK